MLRESQPLAVEITAAIRRGDITAVRRLLDTNPGLAGECIRDARGSAVTLLHVVAGWPGFFPNGPVVTRMLIESGADPDERVTGGRFAEAPLHLAAWTNDAGVAAALIDGGADVEITHGSIGTPLDNAIAYGCWDVARLLVSRGARVDELWHAAALGMHERVLDLLGQSPPSDEQLSEAFFQACTGGQRRTAALMVLRAQEAQP